MTYTSRNSKNRDKNREHIYWWAREMVAILETMVDCSARGLYPTRAEARTWADALDGAVESINCGTLDDPDGVASELVRTHELLIAMARSTEGAQDDWSTVHDASKAVKKFFAPVDPAVLKEALLDTGVS